MVGTVGYREQTQQAFVDAEQGLLAAHGELVESPAGNVEGLDRAACSGHITDLARLAMGASAEGISAEQWRTWVREGLGDRGEAVLAAAEHCMRVNGLWPWPQA
ncbi:MAG TPA: hypothetical protein VFL99_07780 [Segeticoccus sp.]|uniref:hypothetical protein n=1 Tax=Segeticoccus sp. TaxID=2706531 RepID=UPI002D7FDE4B|nr:hypothetical protein [Segeticoccus sp.]HET8600210.1 hypothetical protein [Segeticoccus sp.]